MRNSKVSLVLLLSIVATYSQDIRTTIVDEYGDSFKGRINLDIEERVWSSWKMYVLFDDPVFNLQIWRAAVIRICQDNRVYEMANMLWNGNLDAGSVLEMSFLARTVTSAGVLGTVVFNEHADYCTAPIPTQPDIVTDRTEGLADLTEAPENPTEDPLASTEAPIDPTEAQVLTTKAQVGTTEAQLDTTEALVDTTEAQVDPTDAPEDPTDAPVNPTETGEETITVCATCMSDVVITNRWSGNFEATITVTLTNAVTQWNMNIYFSEPVDTIDVYQAIVSSISNDKMVYSISNENYNGDQSAGATLTLGFQASYSGSEPSTIRIENTSNQPDCCTEVVVTLPIPTAAPGEGCATCCSTTTVTSEWQGNFVGEFTVTITRRVSNGWTAEIYFSSAVNSLTMHDTDVIESLNGNTVYQIRNRQHNADYSPGDENTQSFQATISGNTPTFYVYMVGQPQCCGGGCETSEVDPTDPPQVDPTEAPVDPTEAHVYPTETLVDPTEAPVDPTEAAVDPTEAQVDPTEAPVDPTEAHVYPTVTPVDPTEAPVDPTEAAVDPTEAQVDPTEALVDPTEAHLYPTETPVDPTEAPIDPTEAAVDPTEAEVDPTEAPVNPTEAGEETITVCATCMSDVVITNRWSGNFEATITVTLTNAVTQWNMDIYFSEPVDSIDVYQAIESSTSNDKMVYSINNENYNGDQSAGATLTLGFQASYSGLEPSTIRIENMSNQPDCCTEVVVTLPIPTAAPGEGCATCCSTTTVTSEWQGNFVGEFTVTITRRVSNGWTAEIYFSSAVNSLTMHDTDVIESLNGNTVYQIRNRQHNADYSPGDENTQSFQATISGNTPTFYVYMVGQPQCCGGGCETSEVDPTDPPQVDPTEAPVDPTEAHVYPTETLVDPTEAPVDPTEAAVDPTEAQVDPTEAPVDPTEAHVYPTVTPVDPTEAAVDSTEAAVDPTEAQVDPTEALVDPTEAHLYPTETPVDPTEAPIDPTEAAVDPTEAEVDPTEAPVNPTEAGEETITVCATCMSDVVITNRWSGNFEATITVTLTNAVTQWNMDIYFSEPVDSIDVYQAIESSTSNDKMVYSINNKNYNGDQSAGATLTLGFQASYSGLEPSTIRIENMSNQPDCCTEVVVTLPIPTAVTDAPQPQVTDAPEPQVTDAPQPEVTDDQQPQMTDASQPQSTDSEATADPIPTLPANAPYDYSDVLYKSILFYEAQRSGDLPENNRIPYRGDSALDDAGDNGEDLTGGWYDAGDYVKFGHPMAGAVTVLAWGLIEYKSGYEAAGELQNMYDSIKWATDYFLKCHTGTNEFYAQVGDGDIDHAYWGRPEEMTVDRPAFKVTAQNPGSDVVGETAAALAATSIAFQDVDSTYAATLLSTARELYTFAKTYMGKYSDAISDAAQFYSSSGYKDEIGWAAAWLYRATSENQYLTDAENFYNSYGLGSKPWAFDWDDKKAGLQLLLYSLTGDSKYSDDVEEFIGGWVSEADVDYTPLGLAWRIQWSPNRYSANVAFLALVAADLGIEETIYRTFAKNQINYMLGDSGRSYVVGFGNNPPDRPHHGSSSCPDLPAPCGWDEFNYNGPNPQILYGALVGGPDLSDNFQNDRTDFIQNEVTCDYNAGFQSSVAGIIKLLIDGNYEQPQVTDAPQPEATDAQQPQVTDSEATDGPIPTLPANAPYDYSDVLYKSILFYEAQRSGDLPENNRIPYRGDSALDDAGDNGEDLTGGWYDAGDYVKFGHPMAGAVTVLAWGLIEYKSGYEAAGELQNMYDSIKWATDYFLKCHTGTNEFYAQVGDGDIDHAYWGRPEEMTVDRPAFKVTAQNPGSDVVGETAAALAATSIAFQDVDSTYAATLLSTARELYTFAKTYMGKYSDAISDAAQFYSSSGYKDEIGWAAAWLYRATSENQYLTDAENFYNSYGLGSKPWAFDWDDKKAGLQLLLYSLTGDSKYSDDVEEFIGGWVSEADVDYTPLGLAWRIQWSPNRYSANVAFLALVAADLGIEETIYRTFAKNQINYMLGDSGRSYVVGFGNNPPDRPHHGSSSCPDLPAPCGWDEFNYNGPNPQILYGALVGGPDLSDNFQNDRTDFIQNEVTCDYNAGFQSSVAGIIKLLIDGNYEQND